MLEFLYDAAKALHLHWLSRGEWIFLDIGCLVTAALVTIILWCWGHRLLGRGTKLFLELVDKKFLSVDIHTDRILVFPFMGRVEIYDLSIDNLQDYSDKPLMTVQKILVDIEMWKLMRSFGKNVLVEELNVTGLTLNVETNINNSNVQELIDFITKKGTADPAEEDQASREVSRGSSREMQKLMPDEEPGDNVQSGVITTLGEVHIRDIQAEVTETRTSMKFRAHLEDIVHQDFSNEFRERKGKKIVRILLKSVLKSAVANTTGFKSCFGGCWSGPRTADLEPAGLVL